MKNNLVLKIVIGALIIVVAALVATLVISSYKKTNVTSVITTIITVPITPTTLVPTTTIKDCSKIKDQYSQSRCYLNFAIASRDSSICAEVHNPLSPEDQDLCYNIIAVNSKDLTICNKIQSQTYRDACDQGKVVGRQDTNGYTN